jgi:hypothetical protein
MFNLFNDDEGGFGEINLNLEENEINKSKYDIEELFTEKLSNFINEKSQKMIAESLSDDTFEFYFNKFQQACEKISINNKKRKIVKIVKTTTVHKTYESISVLIDNFLREHGNTIYEQLAPKLEKISKQQDQINKLRIENQEKVINN